MRPLEGVKIVEMGIFVVIPAAARLLSDWGADVIKVEKSAGDNSRGTNVPLRLPNEPDCCPYFAALNSGKKLISLNLKNPEGLKVFMDILAEADVFMTNFRYGGLTRLGLDYETLHKKFPG
jgi:crotonobetainyl-CoA:carnitine CoA-transferase CaiB-like acyl-CoA transferase